MTNIKLLILDVLKPHHPSMLELAKEIARTNNVSANLRLLEVDEKTETIQIIIKGENIDVEKIRKAIEEMGGSVHSMDEISIGPEFINSMDYTKLTR